MLAVHCARNRDHGFSDLSVDFIYGIPTLSDRAFAFNLEKVVALKVPHISAYSLTIEPKTLMDVMIRKNQLPEINNNKSLSAFIRSKEPTFDLCIACGSCAATCSAAQKTDFSLRKLNLLIKRGELEGIEAEIKKCMFCGKCLLVCPRGVNTRKLILTIIRAFEKHNVNAI